MEVPAGSHDPILEVSSVKSTLIMKGKGACDLELPKGYTQKYENVITHSDNIIKEEVSAVPTFKINTAYDIQAC